ncbi:beta-Ala-His dipeptidase [Borrelia hermsii]|uniref:Cytosol non-specific dipeptidase n=3 Tax=Borrelia hermsii TaxID=140 RepID=A0AAN0X505_BORHE|nr:beta-Ala-His dipeptidase [Borrelia hermsii]AAX17112.1 aminoacyl-histidine dipeptidase [Borrelia hermsii DAH]AJW73399.1 aminoacyl-histidine dipeptidase [Borrelia hermsii CC1]AMR75246.1 Aminoacyl-histidine dipeptidase [Borrelia hermsii]ANA43410.1 aminoacyl-histidine dipeptidase [Borrelia hermsii HS1]UPA07915.1 beta-Ala-His dipeptidase [Borrelia hermsii DAH]
MENVVIRYFKQISQIPRCSKNLKGISNFIKEEAKKFGYSFKEDGIGNIVVGVKANGCSNMLPIILQAHTDMVCEKNESVMHDFEKDPINIIEDNGYFVASGTTLGADDGIGVAMMLAIMSESLTFKHPDLELLFTVDEEIGLIGAIGLDPNLCSGKMLINLDGEEEGYFLVGCAGSRLVHINFEPQYRQSRKKTGVEIFFTGLKGGHSGADIHIDLANSLKLMFFALNTLRANMEFEIGYISGGDKSNAIPREAKALILIEAEHYVLLERELKSFKRHAQEMYTLDSDFEILLRRVNFSGNVLDDMSQDKLLNMGMAFLHGVQKVENYDEKLIRTSLNFASLLKVGNEYQFIFTIRSLLDIEKEYIFNHLKAISDLSGANLRIVYDYSSWKPAENSKLLNHLKNVYKDMYLKEAKTVVIHAGLETGIISAKFGGIDSVTIGPWIKSPHTPRERVDIASTIRVYNFLKRSLETL